MAKNAVFERDPTELKKELRQLVKLIIEEPSSDEENGFGFIQCVEKADQTLQALKDLKDGGESKHRSSSYNKHSNNNGDTTSFLLSCPMEFRCPLSKELMRDPVIISSGQTYDRPLIQKWLKTGKRTCPITQQVLSNTILTPNHLVKDLITQWCKNHCVQFPNPLEYSNGSRLIEADHALFLNLLTKMSSNLSDQKESARALRSLTKKTPSFRALFGESDKSVSQLITPLSQIKNEIDLDLQEDLITTLLNLSIYDNNKKLVAETPMVISVLIDALRSKRIETRCNSAAALFTLSALDSNKTLIGKNGALKPLFENLENANPLVIKDAASAIFNLCIDHENKARAVRDGAVGILLKKIVTRVHVDELLSILTMLSSYQKGVEEMSDFGAVSCLISLIKETNCGRNKENCIAILYGICYNDRTKWKEMREEERVFGTFSRLAQSGSSRAKRKASGILDRLHRGVNLTHTT